MDTKEEDTHEEMIAAAISFFEITLKGLEREDLLNNCSLSVEATYAFNGTAKYNINTVGLSYVDPGIYDILSRDYDNGLEAAKHLAFCSCAFALQNAEAQLDTRPDEQGWMSEPMSFWYKLKNETIEFKNKYLSDVTI